MKTIHEVKRANKPPPMSQGGGFVHFAQKIGRPFTLALAGISAKCTTPTIFSPILLCKLTLDFSCKCGIIMIQTTKEITIMAKITMSHDGLNYEIETYLDFGGCMVGGDIYEVVHPTWKIFRTRHCKHFAFWMSDFETVREGVEFCFTDYIEDIQQTAENYKKYYDFIKGA